MFLHSGASLHGHEYSDRPAPPAGQHTYKRSPLLRSAFANPKVRPVSLDGARPSLAAEPRRPFSDFVARLPEPVVRFLEPEDKETLCSPMTEDAVSTMSGSELSDGSQAASEAATVTTSETTSKRRRSRTSSRASRAKNTTTFALAYPAPRFGGKKRVVQKVSPKLFLQLQEVSLNKRPRPVLDVFPSSRIAGPVIAPRLAKRFPGLFGPKGELGSADVVLMRSEDYDTVSEDVDSEDEEGRLAQRQPVAVLSPVKKSDQTEIVLDDGSVWVARPLPTGSFDFVRTDECGTTTTARWARRPAPKTAPAPTSTEPIPKAGRTTPESADVKYTFSIINPDSRRHPIMATLTPQFLDIQDSYTSVSTSSGRYPPCRPLSRAVTVNVAQQLSNTTPTKPALSRSISSSAAEAESEARRVATPEPDTERTTHPIDEATKLLISVTAVFLALESGWSPYFRPHAHHTPAAAAAAAEQHPPSADPSITSSTTVTDTVQTTSRCRPSRSSRRRNSSDDYHHRTPPEASISRDQSPASGSFTTTIPTAPPAWWDQQSPSPSQQPPSTPACRSPTPTGCSRPPARRATSTGAAFMQRTRIASAQQHQHIQESSDSEHAHAPSSSSRKSRRPRILSHSSSHNHASEEKAREKAVRHQSLPLAASVPIPSSPTLPLEFQSPIQPQGSIDKVVVSIDSHRLPGSSPNPNPAVVHPPSPSRLPSHQRSRRSERDRKTQSAYYTPSPPMVTIHSHTDNPSAHTIGNSCHQPQQTVEILAVPAPRVSLEVNGRYKVSPTVLAERQHREPDKAFAGFGGKMRSLGHWFRRLGHGQAQSQEQRGH